MKAFDFDHYLIDAYERFSRSFSAIRAEDLETEINAQYDAGKFWPDALLSLNPRFLAGPNVDELVASGDLDAGTGQVFRFGSTPITFHRHQAEAIAKAKSKKSFVVTTGTGSGKSLCFFVPIVDTIIKARRAGKPRRTMAIIVYPMNALANSQMKEIDKFISQSGLPENLKPIVKRYTGQESQEERQRIAANPPDILLTNYMMAELLLTRQDELDSKVIGNAAGLEFIVLDELHTYRGRQPDGGGADEGRAVDRDGGPRPSPWLLRRANSLWRCAVGGVRPEGVRGWHPRCRLQAADRRRQGHCQILSQGKSRCDRGRQRLRFWDWHLLNARDEADGVGFLGLP
jgi:hypothetical protein